MYESPITMLVEQVTTEVEKTAEGEILKAISRVGVTVDKYELFKALAYDRDQYEKGYRDGIMASRWIPTTERMPEEWQEVLYWYDCNNHNRGFLVGFYKKADSKFSVGWDDDYAMRLEYVKAWMPLPEPYNESEE